jgi:hypothetical protein
MKTFKQFIEEDNIKVNSYKDYYKNYLNLINESPVETGKDYDNLNNKFWNLEHTQQVLTHNNIEKIESLNIFNINLDVHLTVENNIHYLYFISPEENMIKGLIFFKELLNNGIEELSIFNTMNFRGLIHYLYVNYILKRYNYIMSDALHSTQAKRFWEGLFFRLKNNKNFKFYSFDLINKNKTVLTDINQFDEQYGKNMENIRLIIERTQ